MTVDDNIRFVTIATFTQPHEVHLARTFLESQEIPCLILDEFIHQMHHFISPGTGGIRLQVPEQMAEEAYGMLAQFFEWEQPASNTAFSVRETAARYLKSLFRSKLLKAISVAIVAIILIMAGNNAFQNLMKPKAEDGLHNRVWCVNSIHWISSGHERTLTDITDSLIGQNIRCMENLFFREDGIVGLPISEFPNTEGTFIVEDERLIISAGNAGYLNGSFVYELNWNKLTLASDSIEIYLTAW